MRDIPTTPDRYDDAGSPVILFLVLSVISAIIEMARTEPWTARTSRLGRARRAIQNVAPWLGSHHPDLPAEEGAPAHRAFRIITLSRQ